MCLQLRDLRESGRGKVRVNKGDIEFRSQKVKSVEPSTDFPWTSDFLTSRSVFPSTKLFHRIVIF